jgi:hypothetical protein
VYETISGIRGAENKPKKSPTKKIGGEWGEKERRTRQRRWKIWSQLVS